MHQWNLGEVLNRTHGVVSWACGSACNPQEAVLHYRLGLWAEEYDSYNKYACYTNRTAAIDIE